jgi:Flp pilus assembly protein TadG
MVALSLFVLVGMIGLVLDLGHMYIIKTELQNASDACALAAARELNGDANSLTRAENSGITVGGQNRVDFQSGLVNIQSSDITFSETLDGSYVTSASVSNIANIKYVKCTLPLGGIQPWFMAALGAGTQTVGSMAVATLSPSQTNCAVPIGLCQQGAAPGYGYIEGQWYSGKFGTDQGESLTGSYNWVDFTPSEGGGAAELKNLLAGTGQCNLPSAGTPVGEQGQIAGLTDAWNSRFGIYKGGGQYNQTTAPPDFSGYAYTATTWPEPAPQNAYSGSSSIGAPNYQAAKSASMPYQASNPVGLTGYPLPTNTDHSKGSDRRLAVVPIVDCNLLGGSNPQTVPVVAYGCVFLLSPIKGPSDVVLEFRSLGDCASSGLGGGTIGPLVPVLVQ